MVGRTLVLNNLAPYIIPKYFNEKSIEFVVLFYGHRAEVANKARFLDHKTGFYVHREVNHKVSVIERITVEF